MEDNFLSFKFVDCEFINDVGIGLMSNFILQTD